jgi:hypothetical protein
MLAKAGEGDREIKTKMVSLLYPMRFEFPISTSSRSSQNICSLASGKRAKQADDEGPSFTLSPFSPCLHLYRTRTRDGHKSRVRSRAPKDTIMAQRPK